MKNQMPSQRQMRFSELIRSLISECLLVEDFYNFNFETTSITISYVKMSKDLRLANVYGLNKNFSQQGGAIMNFINAVRKKSKISIFGSGKQKIDYIDLNDVLECINIILNNSKLKKEIFNVGSGELNSIMNITKIISYIGQKNFGYSTKVTKIPAPGGKIWPDRLMSINKIKRMTGWKPKVSLKQGIEKLMEYEV